MNLKYFSLSIILMIYGAKWMFYAQFMALFLSLLLRLKLTI
ncbi:hypothetical protein AsAng_0028440 [Aureispira anguillae]|uniref:Uncharacterized protein n=1 Tax=Aureispira anguillae TaxID=2864201 RepID=A0A916DRX0_9BACT|nr:hypothetical protein AsAng_0028440 [Aureispira anguillae]